MRPKLIIIAYHENQEYVPKMVLLLSSCLLLFSWIFTCFEYLSFGLQEILNSWCSSENVICNRTFDSSRCPLDETTFNFDSILSVFGFYWHGQEWSADAWNWWNSRKYSLFFGHFPIQLYLICTESSICFMHRLIPNSFINSNDSHGPAGCCIWLDAAIKQNAFFGCFCCFHYYIIYLI